MHGPDEKYRNGQPKTSLDGGVLTHFHSDGTVETGQRFEHGKRLK